MNPSTSSSSSSISSQSSHKMTDPSLLPPYLSHLASIPSAPILRPTHDEWRDSMSYIGRISAEYSNHYGIVQIIPPHGWLPSTRINLDGQIHIRSQQIEKPPHIQVCSYPQSRRVNWQWMIRQGEQMNHKWSQQFTFNEAMKSEIEKHEQEVDRWKQSNPLPSLSPSSSPSETHSPEPNSLYIRSCLYDEMRKIVLDYGRLDEVKRREVEAKYRIKRNRQTSTTTSSTAAMPTENAIASTSHIPVEVKSSTSNPPSTSDICMPPSISPSVPSTSISSSSSSSFPSSTSSAPSIYSLDAEYSYWSWIYKNSNKSKTFYAADVENTIEYTRLREVETNPSNPIRSKDSTSIPPIDPTSSTSASCEFCLSPLCKLVYSPSSWDPHTIAWLPTGILKHLGGSAPGVTDSMIYAGIHHSTFAFHNEDHYLYSLSYYHPPPPTAANHANSDEMDSISSYSSRKIWYGIPGSAAADFERVVENDILPGYQHLKSALSLMPKKQTIFSPSFLVQHGVPVHRIVHTPNSFVITFPQAYHGGFSEAAGGNITESVNFCLPDWLMDGRNRTRLWNSGCGVKATKIYRSLGSFVVISHPKLILSMANSIIKTFEHLHGTVIAYASNGGTLRGSKRSRVSTNELSPRSSHCGWNVQIAPKTAPLQSPLPSQDDIDANGVDVPRAPPPAEFDLQLPLLYRLQAELSHLILDEEHVRSNIAQHTVGVHQRQLTPEARKEEEASEDNGIVNQTKVLMLKDEEKSTLSELDDEVDSMGDSHSNLLNSSSFGPTLTGRMNHAPILSNILCLKCRSSCYLSYSDCSCGVIPAGEVICLRHTQAICHCRDSTITFRFDMMELHQLQQQLNAIVEFMKKKDRREKRMHMHAGSIIFPKSDRTSVSHEKGLSNDFDVDMMKSSRLVDHPVVKITPPTSTSMNVDNDSPIKPTAVSASVSNTTLMNESTSAIVEDVHTFDDRVSTPTTTAVIESSSNVTSPLKVCLTSPTHSFSPDSLNSPIPSLALQPHLSTHSSGDLTYVQSSTGSPTQPTKRQRRSKIGQSPTPNINQQQPPPNVKVKNESHIHEVTHTIGQSSRQLFQSSQPSSIGPFNDPASTPSYPLLPSANPPMVQRSEIHQSQLLSPHSSQFHPQPPLSIPLSTPTPSFHLAPIEPNSNSNSNVNTNMAPFLTPGPSLSSSSSPSTFASPSVDSLYDPPSVDFAAALCANQRVIDQLEIQIAKAQRELEESKEKLRFYRHQERNQTSAQLNMFQPPSQQSYQPILNQSTNSSIPYPIHPQSSDFSSSQFRSSRPSTQMNSHSITNAYNMNMTNSINPFNSNSTNPYPIFPQSRQQSPTPSCDPFFHTDHNFVQQQLQSSPPVYPSHAYSHSNTSSSFPCLQQFSASSVPPTFRSNLAVFNPIQAQSQARLHLPSPSPSPSPFSSSSRIGSLVPNSSNVRPPPIHTVPTY